MWKTVKHYVLPNLTGLLVLSLLLAGAAGAGPLKQVWQSSPTIQSTSTTTFSYQGRLADAAGSPITDNVAMTFKLYDSPTATTPLWEEHHDTDNAIPVSDGLFHVLLGSIEPIPLDIISGDLYLGIGVNGDAEMEPRELLASVPYAMVAGRLAGGTVGDSNKELLNFVPLDSPVEVMRQEQIGSIDWTDLDLTEYTSPSAKAALVRIAIADTDDSNGKSWMRVKMKGSSNTQAHIVRTTAYGSGTWLSDQVIVKCDDSQTIQYEVHANDDAELDVKVNIRLFGYFEPVY